MERSIPELPLSKLRAVPFALQNRALFEGRKVRNSAEKMGGRGVASKGGKKEKRMRENRSVNDSRESGDSRESANRFARGRGVLELHV